MRAFLRVSADGAAGAAGAGEAAGTAAGVAVDAPGLGGAGDGVGAADVSDPCTADAAGGPAAEAAGLGGAPGGACARTGPKAARLAPSNMRETTSLCTMTSRSVKRRSTSIIQAWVDR